MITQLYLTPDYLIEVQAILAAHYYLYPHTPPKHLSLQQLMAIQHRAILYLDAAKHHLALRPPTPNDLHNYIYLVDHAAPQP